LDTYAGAFQVSGYTTADGPVCLLSLGPI